MMNIKCLANLLILLIICVSGLPLNPGESERSRVTQDGAWAVARLEHISASNESEKHQYHIDSSRKKFFLNPAKVVHNIKAKKAYSNFEAHTENIRQLALAQRTDVVKVTRSKSGNKNHYEAVHF